MYKEYDYEKANRIKMVNFILDRVRDEDLLQKLEVEEANIEAAIALGERSEANVGSFLEWMKRYGLVVEYKQQKKGGKQDRGGMDFRAMIADEAGIPGLGHVWVQVKSSATGVTEFVGKMGMQKMLSKRIVVVDGHKDREEIFNQFWEGVFEVARYKGLMNDSVVGVRIGQRQEAY